jgi:transposase
MSNGGAWNFAWLGSFRRLLVRHERYLSTFRAFFLLTLILISLRYV